MLWQPNAPRGSFVLVFSLFMGMLIPFAMLVDGEKLEDIAINRLQNSSREESLFCETLLNDLRRLELVGQILLAKTPTTEVMAKIRTGDWKEARQFIEPIQLKKRSFRHAIMDRVILVGADLNDTSFQGARLIDAQLQGVNLESANMQGAIMSGAQFLEANLFDADLKGANLLGADLQGANLLGVNLQFAILKDSNLQSAAFQDANLQFANLNMANLQGAILYDADLQGANLSDAILKGTDLSYAKLYSTNFAGVSSAMLIDLREIRWQSIPDKNLTELANYMKKKCSDKSGVTDSNCTELYNAKIFELKNKLSRTTVIEHPLNQRN